MEQKYFKTSQMPPHQADDRPWRRYLGVALFVAGGMGCNPKVTITVAHHGQGQPADLSETVSTGRNYLQSRGKIDLVLNTDQISATSTLILTNATTNSILINTTANATRLVGGEDLPGPMELASTNTGHTIRIAIYPFDPNFAGKFAYGANQLKLDVDEQTAPKSAQDVVTIQDFPYGAPSYSSFASDVQESSGFQGEMIVITGPFLNNGVHEVSVGTVGIINR